ncbi:hypothetical protein HOP50_10g58740 [Chloropicon primus]|uniref:Uncharacterized protein n=2 Tax=Chloropicon primus TaxID=1764295 RepID=A0A5B8MS93_9CHLO|nr:hypothetical protein A3770_10p58540 [Chloropicon primus]UPR02548.1 hypothetical protein HOP50_10g58740 [Chloropicon primus]|eukprot:QDZ23336.1 hypothetical protein A3770_10p58540 [Chloropicon primus]
MAASKMPLAMASTSEEVAGGGGVHVGVSLALILGLDNARLKKLCRRKAGALRSMNHYAFVEHKRNKVEHEALSSLWEHFTRIEATLEDLLAIVMPLLDEWCTCEDLERRGLLLRLVSNFFEAELCKFSSCLALALSKGSQEVKYACVLILSTLVRESTKSNWTTEEKDERLRALSGTFPSLLQVCAGVGVGEAQGVPTKLTSIASDCVLLVVIEILSLDRLHSSVPVPSSNSETFLSSAQWLWEKLPLLVQLLERHEEWAMALAGNGGVIHNSRIMIQSLGVMKKRVSKMESFRFANKDEDNAKVIHACCWVEWSPLLLFDLKTYRSITEKYDAGDGATLKKATSALKYASAAPGKDGNDLLLIHEAIFRKLVSAGIVIGLGRYEPSTEAGVRYLEGVLDAMVGITSSSSSLGLPLCDLASRISVFAMVEVEGYGSGEEVSSAAAKDFVTSVLKSCTSCSNVSTELLRGLLTNPMCSVLAVNELTGLLCEGSDPGSLRGGLAALDAILGMGIQTAGNVFEDKLAAISDRIVGLKSKAVEDEVRLVLSKLPARNVIESLLHVSETVDEEQPLDTGMLLEFLAKIGPEDHPSVESAFQKFVEKTDPKKAAKTMRDLGEKDKTSKFWGVLLRVVLKTSAADKSNQLWIQVLSGLSPQLSSESALVSDFVTSALRSLDSAGQQEAVTVFDRLHPFLVLRIVSKLCFDEVVAMRLETRLLTDDDLHLCDDLLGHLLKRMTDPSEDLQVRKLCSELCGKVNPNVSFSLMLALLREGIRDRNFALSRACLYAYCCSFANHKGSAPMTLHTRCDLLAKEVLALFKAVSSVSGDDGSGSNESKKTQLGCLDCFGSILVLKLENRDLAIDPMAFSFAEVASVLLCDKDKEGSNKLGAVLGLEKSFDLLTHSFLANSLITICPRLKESPKMGNAYASHLIPGILKHMVFRTSAAYADEGCLPLDEILLQVLFISSYHLPGPVVAEFAPDVIGMIISIMSKGLPSKVQVAAARVAACLLTKDDLILCCKDVLQDLEQVMSRSARETTCSSEMRSICHAIVSAMNK